MADQRVYSGPYTYSEKKLFWKGVRDVDGDRENDLLVASRVDEYYDCEKLLEAHAKLPAAERHAIETDLASAAVHTGHQHYQTCLRNPQGHVLSQKTVYELEQVILTGGGEIYPEKTPLNISDGVYDPQQATVLWVRSEIRIFDTVSVYWSPVRFIRWTAVLSDRNDAEFAAVVKLIPKKGAPLGTDWPIRALASELYLKPQPSYTLSRETTTDTSDPVQTSRFKLNLKQGIRISIENDPQSFSQLGLGQNVPIFGSSSFQWLYRGQLGVSWNTEQAILRPSAAMGFRKNFGAEDLFAGELGIQGGLSQYLMGDKSTGIEGAGYLNLYAGWLGAFVKAGADSAQPGNPFALTAGILAEP